jgi:hypothetical protein
MIEATHAALVLRDARGNILDVLELDPDEVVTLDAQRNLMRRHGARTIERITTTERRLA